MKRLIPRGICETLENIPIYEDIQMGVCFNCWMHRIFNKQDTSLGWVRDEAKHQYALGRDYYGFWQGMFELMLEEQQNVL